MTEHAEKSPSLAEAKSGGRNSGQDAFERRKPKAF